MSPEKYQEWLQFLSGKWIKGMPDKPGKYFVATLDGMLGGQEVIVYRDFKNKELKMARPWGGYIWSEPTPDLPFP